MTSPISLKKNLKTQLNLKFFKDLNEAIKAEDFEKFENVGAQVLEKIGHFNTQNKEGKTALLLVAEPVNDRFSSATLQMINYLLKNGADPLIQDLDGNNSLHYLLRAHNSYMDIKIKMMSSLLEYGAKLDQKNEVGHLPQHLLFQVNEKISDLKMLQFLTTKGIDLDTPGEGIILFYII